MFAIFRAILNGHLSSFFLYFAVEFMWISHATPNKMTISGTQYKQ